MDEDKTSYFLAKDGIVHSLVVTFGLKPIYPKIVDDPKHYKQGEHSRLSNNGISYLARFQNGRPGFYCVFES